MTQNGVVTRILANGRAEVAVERGTACGGHCGGGCDACVYASRILVPAENPVYAKPGDKVLLESETKGIVGAALLVYMLPLLFFFAGYAVGALWGLPQGACAAASLIGAGMGAAAVVWIARRRKKEITFRIKGSVG